MLCTPVFIFTSVSSALYGAHVVVYRSDCRYLPYSIHFSEFMLNCFHEKTDKTQNTLCCARSYLFLHKNYEKFAKKAQKVSRSQTVPKSQKDQREKMRQALVAKETETFEEIAEKRR